MKTFVAILAFYAVSIFDVAWSQTSPQAEISWTYTRTAVEDGFKLERKLGPANSTSPWTTLPTIGPGVNSVIDATVLANQEYCYRLSAFNATGSSAFSNVACGTSVRLNVPSIPAITLKMSAVSGLQPITVSWTAPTNPKPTTKDWLSLYPAANADTQWSSSYPWEYTKGAASGTFVAKPIAAGTYNVRYLTNDSFKSVMRSYDVVVK